MRAQNILWCERLVKPKRPSREHTGLENGHRLHCGGGQTGAHAASRVRRDVKTVARWSSALRFALHYITQSRVNSTVRSANYLQLMLNLIRYCIDRLLAWGDEWVKGRVAQETGGAGSRGLENAG